MKKLIYLEDAIDAIAEMMPQLYTPDGSHPADEEIFRAQENFADCIKVIENLPSAEPEKILFENITLSEEQLKEATEKAKKEINHSMPTFFMPEQRWIPVSERLPEEEGVYLATGSIFKQVFVYTAYWNGRFWDAKPTVRAWMPLPEPDREEDNGRKKTEEVKCYKCENSIYDKDYKMWWCNGEEVDPEGTCERGIGINAGTGHTESNDCSGDACEIRL